MRSSIKVFIIGVWMALNKGEVRGKWGSIKFLLLARLIVWKNRTLLTFYTG